MNIEKVKFYSLSVLSGILIGTSGPSFPPWATLFCLVPLWFVWQKKDISLKQVFITGWFTQLTLSLIGFHWVAYTISEFGKLPVAVAYAGLFLFSAAINIYIPLSGLIWAYLNKKFGQKKSSLTSLLLLVSIFVIGESVIPRIFPWNYAYSLFNSKIPVYNLAEYIGFEGLSTLVLVFNALLLKVLISWKTRRSQSYFILSGTLLAVVTLNILGFIVHKNITQPDSSVKVLIVQTNIGNSDKIQVENNLKDGFVADFISNKIFDQTSVDIPKISQQKSFVIWPETAFPSFLDPALKGFMADKLFNYVKKNKIHLITGAYGYNSQKKAFLNSLFFIGPDGTFTDRPYRKYHLLAFGEYMPFSDTFPSLRKYLPQIGNFTPGDPPQVRELGGIKLGPQICYEGLFPKLTVDLANQGAEILINVTNDSWFGPSQPYQHLQLTLARSIETRRPLIRATNTGHSTAILANGHIYKISPLHKEYNQVLNIPYVKNPQPTFYQKFYWLNKICVFLLFITTLIFIVKKNV